MARILVTGALAAAAVVFAATAVGAGGATIEQAERAGWDCAPRVLILGYYHCAPPGKPSVLDMIQGDTTAPSIVLRVFRPDGSFAGTETLVREDLFREHVPPCPAESLAEWALLPFGYYACHHFAA